MAAEDESDVVPSHPLVEMDAEMRNSLFESHPIREHGYVISTPMLKRTYAVVRERVFMKRTGVFFFGTPRVGKSTCAQEMKRVISAEFPRAYVTLASLRRSSRASESHMFRLLLEAEDHALSSRKTTDLLFENIKNHIRMQLSMRGGNHFVLILDEMQLLNDVDFEQLLVFHNALALQKINMTTIGFAQPEIHHVVTAMITKGQRQLLARFLTEGLAFKSCSSIEELSILLVEYDENSEFPEGSGWSYTRFFLPIAFAHGFRLAPYARKIWKELQGATSDGVVPMEHLCFTIEYLLLMGGKLDCANFVLSEEDITEAVDASHLKLFDPLMHRAAD